MKRMRAKGIYKQDERGIASILVTMIMMIVLSMIVLGFATIARREQNSSLTDQLSSQAFYAAETGVNDAYQTIKTVVAEGDTVAAKTTCNDSATGTYSSVNLPSTINSTEDIAYTCLLVDTELPTLLYQNIGTDTDSAGARVIPLNGIDPTSGASVAPGTITLTWRPNNIDDTTSAATVENELNSSCPTTATADQLLSAQGWGCGFGLLRVEIVPTTPPFSEATLLANEETYYFVPTQDGGGNATYKQGDCDAQQSGGVPSSGECGNVISVHCQSASGLVSDTYCKTTISGLSGDNYTMRVESLYQDSGLDVSAASGVDFTGAQILIDSTGKAQNVLKRIQVRYSLTSNTTSDSSGTIGSTPDDAVQANGSICKRFYVFPNYFVDKSSGACSY